jgi:hypothetical protein
VIITGAFFARAASVTDEGLSAHGAVCDRYMLNSSGEFQMTLVVLMQAAPGEGLRQSVEVDIYDSARELIFSKSREFTLTVQGDNHYRIFRITGDATPGRTSVVISSGNGNALSLPLTFVAFDPVHRRANAARIASRRDVRPRRSFRRRGSGGER